MFTLLPKRLRSQGFSRNPSEGSTLVNFQMRQVYLILEKLQIPKMGDDIHQNKSNAIMPILILCSKKGNSGCDHITHNFCHNCLQKPFHWVYLCHYWPIIELFAYIPIESSHIIGTNILNCLLTIATCSCYNKNNIWSFSSLQQ